MRGRERWWRRERKVRKGRPGRKEGGGKGNGREGERKGGGKERGGTVRE